jgi:hypothetical protein
MADIVVDTEDVDAETVAGLIVSALGAGRPCA